MAETPDHAELRRRIADMAFNADVGMATCKRCGDAVPYIILPNLQTDPAEPADRRTRHGCRRQQMEARELSRRRR